MKRDRYVFLLSSPVSSRSSKLFLIKNGGRGRKEALIKQILQELIKGKKVQKNVVALLEFKKQMDLGFPINHYPVAVGETTRLRE